ncbi:Allophanate hydrolase [Actinomadura rubteroloni]|uniref:Allophanate hydrolase n=1 Tax=Actinomadura rubteroloni TaxID=1926885 RepID=A0A2P4UQS4_9ACTN|nr:allophanate hydrolase [Actinomadura rubteroloni]POM27396.1 Allophanate hydrolase [Actinomadura rubteroloni]
MSERAVERVRRAYARIAGTDRPEVWIDLRPAADVLAEAAALDDALPLAGTVFAVKGNIDVAGLPTTAGCPSYAHLPDRDATAVARLRAAGSLVLGTTNLDQFATGLVGTRSPYGAVRNAVDPAYAAGGSSSGSAVAVALGVADFALGTDTAGSGRVPAAFNGVVGLKPTYGLVPADGVVPACRSLDCVTVFARSLAEARRALAFLGAPSGSLAARRPGPWRVAAPSASSLGAMDDGWAERFAAASRALADAGVELLPVDPAPFLEAAELLYDGAFVAERYAAVGAFVDKGTPDLDPVVASIIGAAGAVPAHRLFADRERLAVLRDRALLALGDADALLLPTTPGHPTLADVAADPLGANARLGRFTNSTNLLGLCGAALPFGTVNGLPFGVMLLGPAHTDDRIAAIADLLVPEPVVRVAVAGAHLSGQPLNHELTLRRARLVATTTTASAYRLFALGTTPPKPGLVRVPSGGAAIEVELWDVPAGGFASFITGIPRPLALGELELADGTSVTGFLCAPEALPDAVDITRHGGWRPYLAAR